jgi:hypothetical protein
VTVFGRESPIRQPFCLQQVERLAASLVSDLRSLGKEEWTPAANSWGLRVRDFRLFFATKTLRWQLG